MKNLRMWFTLLLFVSSVSCNENFIVMGDFGGKNSAPYTTDIQLKVARAIEKVGNVSFFVQVGDNFYDAGVPNVDSHRFRDTFESVYKVKKPWYIIAGNHDHAGNVSAQIAYTHSEKGTGRWKFPSLYYVVTRPLFEMYFIDTVTFDKAQAVWLNDRLGKSQMRVKFVFGHFPVWSAGVHGPTPNLINLLKPLLEKHRVTAYFCGHDHTLQWIVDRSVNYIVTGNAAIATPNFGHKNKLPANSLKLAWGELDKGSFTLVSVTNETVSVTGFSDNLEILFQTRFKQFQDLI